MMGISDPNQTIGILCVDDNPRVAEALRILFSRSDEFDWRGWLPSANELVERVREVGPVMVILDLDMPGRDPFLALEELSASCPDVRVVTFSAHVRREFIERAIDAGAWGYVSKGDGEHALVRAIREIAQGEFVMSREVGEIWDA